MNKKIKKIIKKTLIYSSSILLLNQVMPACWITSETLGEKYRGHKISQKRLEEHVKDYEFEKDFNAFDYLIIANEITHKEKKFYFECLELTNLTFNNYIKLIKKNNREDLKKKIRTVIARTEYEKNKFINHMWIQYKDKNNVIRNFEITINPKFDSNSLKNKEIREILKNSIDNQINKRHLAYSLWGKKVVIPNLNSLIIPGGALLMYYDARKYGK